MAKAAGFVSPWSCFFSSSWSSFTLFITGMHIIAIFRQTQALCGLIYLFQSSKWKCATFRFSFMSLLWHYPCKLLNGFLSAALTIVVCSCSVWGPIQTRQWWMYREQAGWLMSPINCCRRCFSWIPLFLTLPFLLPSCLCKQYYHHVLAVYHGAQH